MHKYYDLSVDGSNITWFFGVGFAVFICSAITWIYCMVTGKSMQNKVRIGILLIFSAIWSMGLGFGSYRPYLKAKEELSINNVAEVSGIVEHFDPMPAEGHKNESFDVKGIHFEYSDFEMGYGFNQSKSHGGPIDEGKYVRIQYLDGRILRLWVKK